MVGKKKGSPKTGGRVAGTPNKATVRAKEAIAAFVDGQSERVVGWMEEIYRDKGALEALKAYHMFLEFHVPKLARTEHTGDKNNPVSFTVKWGE